MSRAGGRRTGRRSNHNSGRQPMSEERSNRVDGQPCDPRVHPTQLRGGHAMSRRLRRSLVLTTLLAFLVAISGAAALTGRAADAPSTTVDGIHLDARTIPEPQAFMHSPQVKSAALRDCYLRVI